MISPSYSSAILKVSLQIFNLSEIKVESQGSKSVKLLSSFYSLRSGGIGRFLSFSSEVNVILLTRMHASPDTDLLAFFLA